MRLRWMGAVLLAGLWALLLSRPVAADDGSVSFSVSPNPAACGETVTFSAGAPGMSKFMWDFGDGFTSMGDTATHEFKALGDFSAMLTAIDNEQTHRTIIQTVHVVGSAPSANAGGPYTAGLGETLVLHAGASTDPDAACGDSIVSYEWDFDNDGIFTDAVGVQVTPPPLSAGTHTVSLRVTDSFGKYSQTATTLTIYNNQPIAAFTATPNLAACNQAVHFDASLSTHGRPDRQIVSYSWDFGDGSTAQWANTADGSTNQWPLLASHAYTALGVFEVSLTVTDNNVPARTDTAKMMVSVSRNREPVANAGGPYTVMEGGTLTLDGTASSDEDSLCGDTLSWVWDLDNDGIYETAGSGGKASAVWNDDWLAPVGLRVTDSFGGVSVAQAVVTVLNAPPVVTAAPAPGSLRLGPPFRPAAVGRRGEGILFRAAAQDPGADDLTFQWSFGAASTYLSQGPAPTAAVDTAVAVYQFPGLYITRVTVTDDDGDAGADFVTTLVTDNGNCTRSRGFWRQGYAIAANREGEVRRLQAYLDVSGYASRAFAGRLQAPGDAVAILEAARGDSRLAAEGELLAAWLNFAHGGVRLNDLIDLTGDGIGDLAFVTVISRAEELLLDPSAGPAQLRQARTLAAAINRFDGDCP